MTESTTVLSFFSARKSAGDWTQQELSEFYRVEGALLQGGLRVVTDRGVSDEGDPWFVFCREEDNGEIIAHFARIDRQYVVVSRAFSGVARGRDFRLLVGELLRGQARALPQKVDQAQNVFLHPTTLLVALVAMSFLASAERSFADHPTSYEPSDQGHGKPTSSIEAAFLSAVSIAGTWIENQVESASKVFRDIADAVLPNTNVEAGTHAHVVASVDLAPLDTTFLSFDSNGFHTLSVDFRADLQVPAGDDSGDVAGPGFVVGPVNTHLPPRGSGSDIPNEAIALPHLVIASATPSAIVVDPVPKIPHNFDSLANAALQSFISTTHFEADVVGKNIVVIDTDVSHVANGHLSTQNWNTADGSTLTIIGILPHPAHPVA
jgi:hypothetical protein